MAYELNKNYYMVSHAGSGKCLNVFGSEQVSNNRNVCLWTKDSTNAQNWLIKSFKAGYKIVTALNQNYALNYYWYAGNGEPGNCDIYLESGNDKDSCILLEPVNATDNIYRIRLKNYDLYLTANGSSDNSDVRWDKKASSGNAQQWKLVDFFGSAPSTESATLTMPSGRICNWNQFYTPINNLTGGEGCTITAVLDVLNFFGPSSYTINDIRGAWVNGQGVNWNYNWPNVTITHPSTSFANTSYAAICEQINLGVPVLLNLGPGNSGNYHMVMCYGYRNGGKSISDFLVMDPAGSGNGQYGVQRTLLEAANYSTNGKGIATVRFTSRKA